eukprot:2711504-Pyramimonas_sp.AAC.1
MRSAPMAGGYWGDAPVGASWIPPARFAPQREGPLGGSRKARDPPAEQSPGAETRATGTSQRALSAPVA